MHLGQSKVPNGPNIDLVIVVSVSEEKFWSPVPEGHDLPGELGIVRQVVPCQAEVSDLDLALVVHQEVGSCSDGTYFSCHGG